MLETTLTLDFKNLAELLKELPEIVKKYRVKQVNFKFVSDMATNVPNQPQ